MVRSAGYAKYLEVKGNGEFYLNNGIGLQSTSNILYYNTSTGKVTYGPISGIQGARGIQGVQGQSIQGVQGPAGSGTEGDGCL